MNQRINNWTEPEDKFLAATVLRYIREGRTQLQAFEDAGAKLDRSAGGCCFRWNAVLRKSYIEEIKNARRVRWGRMQWIAKEKA